MVEPLNNYFRNTVRTLGIREETDLIYSRANKYFKLVLKVIEKHKNHPRIISICKLINENECFSFPFRIGPIDESGKEVIASDIPVKIIIS